MGDDINKLWPAFVADMMTDETARRAVERIGDDITILATRFSEVWPKHTGAVIKALLAASLKS